ncbi:hypothetical protein SD70_27520 [Gordoniibacillus kamchatkensis]|uniref:Uncharacterized protein n=1 Tax=Gordoniibacillus kamchatkensis TaxID=1590651 RepID=A0ABR5ACF5_9BACL|nr:hypothetical protein SD70_27520 [Paenibacillus sp. VKM B-2647]
MWNGYDGRDILRKTVRPPRGSPADGQRVDGRGSDTPPDNGGGHTGGGRWEGRRERSFVRLNELRDGGSRSADTAADRPGAASRSAQPLRRAR